MRKRHASQYANFGSLLNEVFYRRIETLGISATMKFYHSEGRKQLSLF